MKVDSENTTLTPDLSDHLEDGYKNLLEIRAVLDKAEKEAFWMVAFPPGSWSVLNERRSRSVAKLARRWRGDDGPESAEPSPEGLSPVPGPG